MVFFQFAFGNVGLRRIGAEFLVWGVQSPDPSSSRGESLPIEKVVESHVGEEKKSFAQIDSLKRGSVRFERKFFLRLHALKGVENVVFKSDVDFNCSFSAKVKMNKKLRNEAYT